MPFSAAKMRTRRVCRQPFQQRLRVLQIARLEPFSEPAVNGSEQSVSLLRLALIAPEACEAHGGAEFPGFCLLSASGGECALEVCFGFWDVELALGSTRFIMHALP
jgi:hypothetical protein